MVSEKINENDGRSMVIGEIGVEETWNLPPVCATVLETTADLVVYKQIKLTVVDLVRTDRTAGPTAAE